MRASVDLVEWLVVSDSGTKGWSHSIKKSYCGIVAGVSWSSSDPDSQGSLLCPVATFHAAWTSLLFRSVACLGESLLCLTFLCLTMGAGTGKMRRGKRKHCLPREEILHYSQLINHRCNPWSERQYSGRVYVYYPNHWIQERSTTAKI